MTQTSTVRGIIVPALLAALAASATPAHAQYFGRNKVQYDKLSFRVLPTPHFDVHFYPAESLATADAARMAERWYQRHGSLLQLQFEKSPLIFYADPPDFQQTNVIGGMIGQGTGGVTESIRERVIMPFTGSYADNDHVLGHELVHVFQYRLAGAVGGGRNNLGSIPLWLIEGMAEYMSLGRDDPNTAMWLRDAMRRNDLPTLKQLTRGQYFPYRYGQALWAYIGGRWGDEAINTLFRAALRGGWESAVREALGVTSDSLSAQWHAAIRAQYADVASRTAPDQVGRSVIGGREREENVAPVISPDGKHVVFFSSRGLFNIDLYLADAATGRVIRRLTSSERDPHIDDLSFINSAGTWSPDGRKVAIVVYANGNNEIAIVNVANGRTERRIAVAGVGAMTDVAWSPDGNQLMIAGLKGGISDLYLYDLAAGRTTQLTNDREAQLQPAWHPDGRSVAFVTDQGDGTDFAELRYRPMRLAILDVATRSVRLLPAPGEGKQINPNFTPDGTALYYVSDVDGVSDIYRVTLSTGETRRVTRIATGVSGITALSPTLSVARSTGALVFSVFHKQQFSIRSLSPGDAAGVVVASAGPIDRSAGILPPMVVTGASVVTQALETPSVGLPGPQRVAPKPYRSRLSLEAVGGPAVGVSFGGGFGPAVGGGVALAFSDMLGNNSVFAVVNAPGNVRDVAASALYVNRSRQWNWGVEAYHIPIASVFATAADGSINVGGAPVPATVFTQQIDRAYFDNVEAMTQRPLSTTRRFEFTAGVQRISFGREVDSLFVIGNTAVDETSTHSSAGPAVTLGSASAAFVGDYSAFAFTSPVSGGRYRFEARPFIGTLNYQTLLADYRRYFFARPFTLAVRGIHFGRYGGDAESGRLQPLFVGHSMLVRGYSAESFDVGECTNTGASDGDRCPEFSRLVGSRMAVANLELRIPLFGTSQFGLVNMPYLPVEVAPFVDAGMAWARGENPSVRFDRNTADRVPVVSTGVAARLNILGAAIVEIFWVHPYQRPGKSSFFGFQLAPGW